MSYHPPRDGVSTVLLASEKPIVRSPAPQHFNRELLTRTSHRDRTLLCGRSAHNRRRRLSLSSQYSWSTTSGEAVAEDCLPIPKYPVPVTTLEQHADPVTRRGRNHLARTTGAEHMAAVCQGMGHTAGQMPNETNHKTWNQFVSCIIPHTHNVMQV